MSKKLLLTNIEEEVIWPVYMQFDANNASTAMSLASSSPPLKFGANYATVLEVRGNISFPGATDALPAYSEYILGTPNSYGGYDYTIRTHAASSNNDRVDTKFSINHLLVGYDRGTDYGGFIADRMYWDDSKGEYMLEINNVYDVFNDSSKWTAEKDDKLSIDLPPSTTTFGTFDTTTYKWYTPTMANNGKIYGTPHNKKEVLCIDPINRTTEVFGSLGGDEGTNSWFGSALAPNGKIYCSPNKATQILVIDPETHITELFGDLPVGTDKWRAAETAPNGKIYCPPYNEEITQILVIDPETHTTELFGEFTGANKWTDAILAPNGKIYCIPANHAQILVIDPETHTTELFGEFPETYKWYAATLAPNGKIYCIPNNAKYILVIDPETNTTEAFGSFSVSSGWCTAVSLPDGRIFCIPYSNTTTQFMMINTNDNTYELFGDLTGTNKYWGANLASDGNIYCTPCNATTVLCLDPNSNGALDIRPTGDTETKPLIATNAMRKTVTELNSSSWKFRGVGPKSDRSLYYATNISGYVTDATKEQLDAMYVPPLRLVYQAHKRVIPTGMKRKIKIPIYGENGRFMLFQYNTSYSGATPGSSKAFYGGLKVEVGCTDVTQYGSTSGQSPSITAPSGYKIDTSAPVYLDEFYSVGGNDKTNKVFKTLGEPRGDGTYRYRVIAKNGSTTKTVYFSADQCVIDQRFLYNDSEYWNGYLSNLQTYVKWDSSTSTYIYYTNTEFFYINNLDTATRHGSFTATTSSRYMQWDQVPVWESPKMNHVIVPWEVAGSVSDSRPRGFTSNRDHAIGEAYYLGNHYEKYTIICKGYNSTDTSRQFQIAVHPSSDEYNNFIGNKTQANNILAADPIYYILPYENLNSLSQVPFNVTSHASRIELPNLGAGTTYTISRVQKDGTTLTCPKIKISYPYIYSR